MDILSDSPWKPWTNREERSSAQPSVPDRTATLCGMFPVAEGGRKRSPESFITYLPTNGTSQCEHFLGFGYTFNDGYTPRQRIQDQFPFFWLNRMIPEQQDPVVIMQKPHKGQTLDDLFVF